MLLITGTVRVPAENLASARPIMKQMLDASRQEPDCVEYVYAEDLFEPGLIHVKELWRTQAGLDLHFQSHHLAAWRATWNRLGIGERNLRLYIVDEGCPV
ncbi:MAG: antibiotic biosynthesis monooxygenase [Sphingomonadaceae bacterium]|nr:antibiotic biosynthesis monooxygenase [Sphingomonadaceae bacterium]